jgi:predicted nucleic acid-binding protein
MQNRTFLVDTSAWILALRKDFIDTVKKRIDHLLRENVIVTNGMVRLELLGGTKTEHEFQRLKTRLNALDTIDTDSSLWEEACRVAFQLRRLGVTTPYTDVLIAASAIKAKATVVHADAHFDLMANTIGLEVESYVNEVRDKEQRGSQESENTKQAPESNN